MDRDPIRRPDVVYHPAEACQRANRTVRERTLAVRFSFVSRKGSVSLVSNASRFTFCVHIHSYRLEADNHTPSSSIPWAAKEYSFESVTMCWTCAILHQFDRALDPNRVHVWAIWLIANVSDSASHRAALNVLLLPVCAVLTLR